MFHVGFFLMTSARCARLAGIAGDLAEIDRSPHVRITRSDDVGAYGVRSAMNRDAGIAQEMGGSSVGRES